MHNVLWILFRYNPNPVTHQRQEAGGAFLTRNTISPIDPSCCTENIVLQNQSLSVQSAAESAQVALRIKEELLGQAGKLRTGAVPT